MINNHQPQKSLLNQIKEQEKKRNILFRLGIILIIVIIIIVIGIFVITQINKNANEDKTVNTDINPALIKRPDINLSDIPEYKGDPYCIINGNIPYFEIGEVDASTGFELYSDLDDLGRCGTAFANLCIELMPTEERGEIGIIKPSGWHTVKYPEIIEDLYLYNRCHLIAYALTGENANEKNLITGTRYMNIQGMLPFENEVRKYIENTKNHVLYRVTPIFYNKDLLARGVLVEAYSTEDQGKGICFNVFIYNVQPGIDINYKTGDSKIE